MATKSNNTQGNPYHDETTGEFTSPNSASQKTEQPQQSGNLNIKLKDGVDLSKLQDLTKTRIKTSITVEAITARFKDLNQVSNIPKLTSARDIEEHITEYFSKQVIDKIDALYGNSPNCAHHQFRPRANPNVVLDLFPNVIGKYRYKDNHAKVIPSDEFYRLKRSWNGEVIYRGISSNGEKARKIINNYGTVDLNNFDYYCPQASNCHGSNVYTTVQKSYADSYTGWNGTLIEGLLDSRSSWHMDEYSVQRVQGNLNISSIQMKVAEHLKNKGLPPSRADQIARSFGKAIGQDEGLVAVLMGLDYYISANHQRNLFNLSKWIIKGI